MRYTALPIAFLLLSSFGPCDDSTGPEDGGGGSSGPPLIDYFVASQTSIQHGDSIVLRWKAEGAVLATVSPAVPYSGDPDRGTVSVRPPRPTTYTLELRNERGADSAQVTIDVSYYAGTYVNSETGDDSRSGENPDEAIRSLANALDGTRDFTAVYVTGGTYPVAIELMDARQIFGGLDPETFFLDPGQETIIAPSAGEPAYLHDLTQQVVLSDLTFVAPTAASAAVRVKDVRNATSTLDGCIIRRCTLSGQAASGGVGLRIEGSSRVLVDRTTVRGGRGTGLAETAGIVIAGESDVTVNNCFVDGGRAISVSSGILVDSSGHVRIGFNTICAEIQSTQGLGISAGSVRVRSTSPEYEAGPGIGCNILFTTGAGPRFGVIEECDDCDPSWLYGNLFVALGVTRYADYPATGGELTESDLNDHNRTTQIPGSTAENVLYVGAVPSNLFRGVDQADYHLSSPLPGGQPNPAIDALDFGWAVGSENHGPVTEDIDGEPRPTAIDRFDLGADEF